MNSNETNDQDQALNRLLKDSRPDASLPPRFQEAVWRRIERLDTVGESAVADWLERLAGLLVRPRLAFATLAALLLLGGITGALSGVAAGKQSAQARYLAAVAPNSIR